MSEPITTDDLLSAVKANLIFYNDSTNLVRDTSIDLFSTMADWKMISEAEYERCEKVINEFVTEECGDGSI